MSFHSVIKSFRSLPFLEFASRARLDFEAACFKTIRSEDNIPGGSTSLTKRTYYFQNKMGEQL